MAHKLKNKMPRQKQVLIFALVAVVALSIIALTRAWLFEEKGLRTMTRIQVPYLYLRDGVSDDSMPIELGEIDVREAGEKRVPFRVIASKDSEFILQLGYTTNLPLTYTIIKVDDNWSTNDWKTVPAGATNTIVGHYLNKNGDVNTANNTQHEATYGAYNKNYVQKNAEPIYWQSNLIHRTKDEHNYVLIVNWSKCDDTVIDKDTDMIYLTAGIPGGGGYSDETN